MSLPVVSQLPSVASEMPGGDIVVAGESRREDEYSLIRVLRISPAGAMRQDWGQSGAYDITSVSPSAVPAQAAALDSATLASRFRTHLLEYVKTRPDGSVDIGIKSLDVMSSGGEKLDFIWITRISPVGTSDTDFGMNGSMVAAETGPEFEETDQDAKQFRLLPFAGDSTLATAFVNWGYPEVAFSLVDSSGQLKAFDSGKINFPEDINEISFADPNTDSIYMCGNVEPFRAPQRRVPYLFKAKLPSK